MTQLVRYEQARHALAEAHRVDEVKDIRDKAEAMAAYARQAKDTDLIRYATEIKVRAERKAGELLRESAERGERVGRLEALNRGNAPDSQDAIRGKKTLADFGVTASESQRWQQVASIPAEHFEAAVEMAKNQVGEVTTAFMLRTKKALDEGKPLPNAREPTTTRKERIKETARLFAEGYTPAQVADVLGISHETVLKYCHAAGLEVRSIVRSRGNKIDPLRVINESVSALTGIAQGIEMLDRVPYTIDIKHAHELVSEAETALRIIRRMVSQLKGIANGNGIQAGGESAVSSDDALDDQDRAAREDEGVDGSTASVPTRMG